ncbi:MAG: alpha/beta fold hydrolase [Fimbriimonadaceae bacterium]
MVGRRHGVPPYGIVVVHGGPGAPGSAYGIAAGLGSALEPFQTADSLDGQVQELAATLRTEIAAPAALVGHSWGAMLALLTAAEAPDLVRTVVLVGSGGFSADAYVRTAENRMGRLSLEDRERALALKTKLRSKSAAALPDDVLEYCRLIAEADGYDVDPSIGEPSVEFQYEINQKVWATAAAIRESGELLERIASVRCPVVAIHGDHDPHPADTVSEPLSSMLTDFTMVILERCGHEPWKERYARLPFFEALRAALLL